MATNIFCTDRQAVPQIVDNKTSFFTTPPLAAVQGYRSLIRTNRSNLIGTRWDQFLSLWLFAAVLVLAANPAQAGKSSPQPNTTTYVPMAMEYENYNFHDLSADNTCLGEDDALAWKAAGGLKPGESFTFTPQYPGCYGHPAAISVMLSWQGSQLELSSNAPDNDFASGDPSQKGKLIIAPNVGNTAQLCMFPHYASSGIVYTITVTNVGNTTASSVVIDGRSDNDWASNFYYRCLNADADRDNWNDSLEHSVANLIYPIGYINGVYQPYLLWGSNYLSAGAETGNADDEIDSSPADFNDDGLVDDLDVAKVSGHLGEGNGIPLEKISPNPGDPGYYWDNTFQWRRYDLDGDGYVAQNDVDIVAALLAQSMPMVEDSIAPTARILAPTNGDTISKGSYFQLNGHVWDNAAVSKVEYLVDGKAICIVNGPAYTCWWAVPKRQGAHEIAIRVYDASGHTAISNSVTAIAQ